MMSLFFAVKQLQAVFVSLFINTATFLKSFEYKYCFAFSGILMNACRFSVILLAGEAGSVAKSFFFWIPLQFNLLLY